MIFLLGNHKGETIPHLNLRTVLCQRDPKHKTEVRNIIPDSMPFVVEYAKPWQSNSRLREHETRLQMARSSSRLLSSDRGIGLPRQQDSALERSSPFFLMDLPSLFFDGGRRREGTQICIFSKRNCFSVSVLFCYYLVPWGPILIQGNTPKKKMSFSEQPEISASALKSVQPT